MPTDLQHDTPERRALEAALVETPDDLTTHSAYADYLVEQGDPRGEFVQAQLALEDPSRSLAERGRLAQSEAKLRAKHAAEWLGDAGRFLVGAWSGSDKPYQHRFARGWPDFVRVLPEPEEIVAAIARSPEFRLLRQLEVVYDMQYHPFEFDQFTDGPIKQLRKGERHRELYDGITTLPELAASPYLTNLRVLKYGFSDDDDGDGIAYSTMVRPFGGSRAEHVVGVLERCPRLEELYLNTDVEGIDELFASELLGNLRVFQYYFGYSYRSYDAGHTTPYPLSVLAENSALGQLTTLRFHPGRDTGIDPDELTALVNSKNLPALAHLQIHSIGGGDEFAARLAASGLLGRLKTLDLAYTNLTDAGAQALAASPGVRNLDVLNVSRNALTAVGVGALRATGVQVVADHLHAADDDDYYYNVDRE